MSEFNLDKVIRLLEHANEQGINVSFADDELSVRFQKGNKIDKVFLDELKLNKPFLIHYFKNYASRSKAFSLPRLQKIERNNVNGIQVSYAQERLWFIDQLEGSLQYHIPSVLQLKGRLSIEALTHAMQQIINRHEVLRTVIREKDGKAWQYIKDKDGWQLNTVDGSMYRGDEAALQNHIQQLIDEPFDLSKDYMIRAHLMGLDDQHYILVVTLHHIASDGWSTSIIVRELVALYNAFEKGIAPDLMPLPVQYADFAVWQRQYLKDDVLHKKLAYWKTKLQDVSTLQLPVDFERPAVQSTRGAATAFSISKEIAEQLQEFSQQQGTTLFMTLLAAFNVLLYRHSGQPDICVGTPIAGRDQQEVEGLIGFFINSLALRNDLSNNPSFTELLQQVKTTTLEAYDHKELPFEKVVEAIVNERNLSRSPVFQVMFVLQNLPAVPEFRLGDVSMSVGNFENNTSKFDLAFFVTETGKGLQGNIRYCTDLFTEKTIEQLAAHFTNLLHAVINSPAESIGTLSMLTPAEAHHLLVELNDTKKPFPDTTVVELFNRQAWNNPGSTALAYNGARLTYRELNENANRLANYLRSKGVKDGSLVPVCMMRGTELITAMLGILKAGGAYVPIDPDYPAERISYMLEDTGALLILTNKEARQRLPINANVEIIELDEHASLINDQPTGDLQNKVKPHQLAYVIYTSGSTGKPKGVMIEHKSLSNLVNWHINEYGVTVSARATTMAGVGFDAFGWEVWPYLSCGASLCIVDDDTRLDPPKLLQLFIANDITHSFIATALVQEFVNESRNKKLALKYLLTGGDKLPAIDTKDLTYQLINNYGPTENTVVATNCHLGSSKENLVPPIGKPILNTVIYLLNGQLQLVPKGSPGEICIGGASVAKGYLNQPALTAEKFIPDPFSTEPGAKLYKSGDLGCWLPDGNIAYLGRIDEQVKIRGYRIELGEIETCLLQSGLVSQAVVLAREDTPGNRKLVAYFVAGESVTKEAISSYLLGKLPVYMVPAVCVQLAVLPVTANGKIDRKALPEPETTDLSANEYTPPRNDAEERLTAIWKELLYVERVGIHDNFFELGGDSIMTIQVVSRARRAGFELQPKDLFIHQTIAGLSAAIADRTGAIQAGEQGILTGSSGLTPIQQWWLGTEPAEMDHFNQGVLLGLDKSVTPEELQQVIHQLVQQHDALRFKFYRHENKWQQEYGSYTGEVITEDLQSVPPGLLASSITETATRYQRSLDIQKGELIRVVVMQTPAADTRNRLLIVIHHLAIDGVSWRILIEEMEIMLGALKREEGIAPGLKSSSYRQWYHALKNYGDEKGVLSQVNYWRQVANAYQPLPADKEYDGPVTEKDLAKHSLRLAIEQTSRLLQDVPRVYHTEINDILLAALAVTISDWSGNEKINIGLEGHGREDIAAGIDISRTVGWFTSLYPLLLVMPEIRSEADLIKSVKEQLRRLPGKGIGYGVLKYINREESLQGPDPWDIVFNYLGQLDNVVRESKWLSGAIESQGPGRSAEQSITEKISVNSSVRAGELLISWTYSSKHYNEETIKNLAESYVSNLLKIIAHCVEQQMTGSIYTPSDYGLGSEIIYTELDRFLSEPVNGTERKYLVEGLYRLSGLQQGMLFHGLYDVGIGAYIEQFACDLVGVDLDILKKSWDQLIRKHSILRSAFYFDAFSLPVQAVYKNVILPVSVLDYSTLDEVAQAAAIKEFDDADRNQGFDFKTSPLMRLSLFRLSEDRYRMLWTSHHILFDGWSFPILMEEFLRTYELLRAGDETVIAEEDRYEDYIRYIERSDKEKEEQYWRNYLEEIGQSTLLPFIEKTIDRNKGRGVYQTQSIHLDAATANKIQAFAQRHRLTLNTLMQGVWAFLLHRYTGNKNIVYGIIVSGRPDDLSQVEQRVGMYINTLPLHAAISDETGIIEWLQTLQAEQVNSRQYQHTPLHVVQGWSGVQGDLFDTLLTFENYPISKVIASKQWALSVANVNMQEQTNYPLSIVIGSSEQINIRFSYNSMLLDAVYVNEIRGHFENVLMQLVEKGDGNIADLSLLTTAEQQQLLTAFNDPIDAQQFSKTVVNIFEEQVIKTPSALAIVFNEEKLSYNDLNERSNQLAHFLSSKGVKEGALVLICINRTMQMMVGVLGILKAGGAYVPVDPSYPADRISYLLEDTGASVLITNNEGRLNLPITPGVEIIDIDSDAAIINGYPTGNLKHTITGESLAYIIYTSGSTGKPKGVMVEHGSLINYLLNNKINYIDKGSENTGSFIHLSYTFDASLTAMFIPLLSGKSVVIGSKESLEVFDDANLLKYAPYDFIKITPAHLAMLQLAFKTYGNQQLAKKLIIGGEALYPAQFDSFTNEGINVEVINEYGPTEATVGCTVYSFHTIADKDVIKNGIPIGKPMDQVVIYILDEQNRLVPVGVDGEICIGGAGVARGYLNQPGLTAEKFIADPFSRKEGTRIYKTGDIGRWLPNGNIDYQGRIDDQVKIRGYRVEPGEVEQVLQQCELVTQGVVLGKEEKEGGKKLVSYYVPDFNAVKSKELELHYQRVASWKELYETEYGQTEQDETIDPEFNIIGWNDSFTGDAIPAEEMREWLDDIVDTVLSEQAGNVLEIGCGTGLVYYQLAGKVNKYIGSDLSRSSINQIKQQISKGLRTYGDTELFTAAAHEVIIKSDEQVDTILLNSMVQYFPGEDYMNDVIGKAVGLIKDKGRIIIGDVRDIRLLELFMARIRMQKTQDSVSVKEFEWAISQDRLQENELCFSPAFFYGLSQVYPQITHIDIQWKNAGYINELSLYRYTVVLYIGIEKESIIPQWQTWDNAANIKTILTQNGSDQNLVAIEDVPNPRLWKEKLLKQALTNRSNRTVGDLVHAVERQDPETKEINQLLDTAAANGYSYRFLVHEDPLKINLLLWINLPDGFILPPSDRNAANAVGIKTNIPLFTDIAFLLQKEIRAWLHTSLPEYMVPSEFIALDKIPLTNNGKADRIFLSQREDRVFVNALNYLPPATELENILAEIWKELLHLERVGIEDNFFELGGHSLLAMRVISAIRKQLEVELNIKELFINPTIGLLAQHIQNLGKGGSLPSIERSVPRPLRIPLSFSQERLWFIDQLDGSVQYHMPAVLRLKGNLNTTALSGALQQIINRHEILRTVIRQEEGQGYQCIKEEDDWHLPVVDGSIFMDDDDGLKRMVKQLIDTPFDLTKDHMIRASLVSLDKLDHLLVVTLHHIGSDGWSTSILVNELVELYNAAIENRSPSLDSLPVQYADYAIWQRKYLTGEAWDKKLGYWRNKLEGVNALELITDYPRPLVQSTSGAIMGFNVSKEIASGLQLLSNQQGATLFMTLLAAFNVLLHRYTGQEDICVGTPVAGRQQQEIEGLIGFFVNTLALRNQLSDDGSFLQLLQQVKGNTLQAYDHQEVPFEKVVEMVVRERDMSRSPLFQVMLVLQNTPEVREIRLGDLQLSRYGAMASAHNTAKFDLTFNITEGINGLQVAVEYSTALYKEQTIRNMMGHFEMLLQSIVKNPAQSIGQLPLLTTEEQNRVQFEFNNTAVDFPTDQTLVSLFEAQVIKSPGATALVFEGKPTTYAELNERANQLAHYLVSTGVRSETMVPVIIERSLKMVIAMLGILKAGAAYIPIDPDYPAERIGYMLQDTGADIIITTAKSSAHLSKSIYKEVIELDNDCEKISKGSTDNLALSIQPQQLAYVIYTSGSTGRPKGTLVEHTAIANLVNWHVSEFGVTDAARSTSMSGVGFDAFGWEIWPYLSAGARIYIIDNDTRLSPVRLFELLNSNQVTHSFITTTLVPAFLNESRHKITSLKYLLTGGDKLPAVEYAGISYDTINNYGPTENTVVTTSYWLSAEDGYKTPPIGKPVSNVSVFILNKQQELVPIGVLGEIYIGGAALARGYLNKPELTTEKFMAVSINGEKPVRLYRSGDRGRWLPDGNIEYLGRIDAQLKIRGFRVEPGEIENVLMELPMLRQAIVVAVDDKSGGKQLVAYVVSGADSFNKEYVIIALKNKLPAYMIPAIFIELDELPVTENGKINFKALPQPTAEGILRNEYVAPRNELEEKLAVIWKELLNVERVGITDNFFELGGHSLLAMRMVAYIERDLLVSIPIKALFQFTCISDLSKYLEIQATNEVPEENTKAFKVYDV